MAHSLASDQLQILGRAKPADAGEGMRFNSPGGSLPAPLQESVVIIPAAPDLMDPMRQERRCWPRSSEQKQKGFKEIFQQGLESRSVWLLASAVTAGSPSRYTLHQFPS